MLSLCLYLPVYSGISPFVNRVEFYLWRWTSRHKNRNSRDKYSRVSTHTHTPVLPSIYRITDMISEFIFQIQLTHLHVI